MTIAGALILFAIGAILKFAVTATVEGIDLGIVGIILMIIGAIGFVIGLIMLMARRRTDVVTHTDGTAVPQRTHTTYVTPADPQDPQDPQQL